MAAKSPKAQWGLEVEGHESNGPKARTIPTTHDKTLGPRVRTIATTDDTTHHTKPATRSRSSHAQGPGARPGGAGRLRLTPKGPRQASTTGRRDDEDGA